MKKLDIKKGTKIFNLTIIKEVKGRKFKSRKNTRYFLVKCVCGEEKEMSLGSLRSGKVKSCGCLKAIKHNDSRKRLYRIWYDMKSRCLNTKNQAYKYYGERGICVCNNWKKSYINFKKWALKNGYKDNLTIDRKDVNGNYNPANCRWATRLEQNCNMRMLKTNKSGYVGVCFDKKSSKWISYLSINNKAKRIGLFFTKKQAARARNLYIDKNKLPNKKNIIKNPLVILESPLSGDQEKNKEYARECMLDCLKRNESPFASHLLYTQCLNDDNPNHRKLGIEAGFEWREAADYTVVYTDLGISKGMQMGIDHATKLGHFIDYRKLYGNNA